MSEVQLVDKSAKCSKELSEVMDLVNAPSIALLEAWAGDGKIDGPEAVDSVTKTVLKAGAGLDGIDLVGVEVEKALDEALNSILMGLIETKSALLKALKVRKAAQEAAVSA